MFRSATLFRVIFLLDILKNSKGTCQDLSKNTILDSLNIHAGLIGLDLQENISSRDSIT